MMENNNELKALKFKGKLITLEFTNDNNLFMNISVAVALKITFTKDFEMNLKLLGYTKESIEIIKNSFGIITINKNIYKRLNRRMRKFIIYHELGHLFAENGLPRGGGISEISNEFAADEFAYQNTDLSKNEIIKYLRKVKKNTIKIYKDYDLDTKEIENDIDKRIENVKNL